MGNIVGALGRHAVKKARRFNVESRTEKYLERNIKNPPPKPEATLREIAKLNQEMPDLMETIIKPNEVLLDRLKNVYVSSADPPPSQIGTKSNPDRPLPAQRKSSTVQYGYVEPESVNPGQITLLQALQLLSKYQLDKKKHNVQSLALEFNMSEKDVGDIVAHFKLYTLVKTESRNAGFDVNPAEALQDPIDRIGLNVITAPEQLERLNEAVAKKSQENEKNFKK